MSRHIERARDQLGDLAGLADKTDRAERKILEQAQKRHAEVQAEIESARPGIEAKPDAEQKQYQELIAERGHLDLVIAQARKHLS